MDLRNTMLREEATVYDSSFINCLKEAFKQWREAARGSRVGWRVWSNIVYQGFSLGKMEISKMGSQWRWCISVSSLDCTGKKQLSSSAQ